MTKPAIATAADRLALFGGRKTVTEPYREQWRKVHPCDLRMIAEFANRDENTSASGDGPIAKFERRFCQLTETKYGLAMNSGTATLYSAYFAVGVKPGDEVIVPSYTWFATAAPLLQLGATPIFCDIDPGTLTSDPDDVERRITPKTRAICVVHIWGTPARLDRLVEIARRHRVSLIEDCSHAHGATFQGRSVGSWGDVGCFSMQGEKPVSAGEGGIAVTNDPHLYDRMLALGHNGRTQNEQAADTFHVANLSLGMKFRPHLYGILLATGSLSRLAELNERRRRNYAILQEELADCPAVSTIETYPDSTRAGFLQFTLRFHPDVAGGWNRGAFVKAAQAEGARVHPDRYTVDGLLHEQALFANLEYDQFGGAIASCRRQVTSDLPVSARLCDELMRLPAFTLISEKYVRQTAQALRKVALFAASQSDLRVA